MLKRFICKGIKKIVTLHPNYDFIKKNRIFSNNNFR